MMTDIRGALERARLLFMEEKREGWLLDAEILLAHVLGRERAFIHREPQFSLSPEQYGHFEGLVQRRIAGEPVAYLVGHKEFMGLKLVVDDRVLVPRPETELLAETALVLLGGPHPPEGSPVSPLPPAPRTGVVTDIGTGSGAVALSLAHYLPRLKIYATDVSPDALEVAGDNARRLGVAGRVTLLPGNLAEPLQRVVPAGALALVTANLPYIPAGEIRDLPRDVREYEPRSALDGGPDGLALYRMLLPAVRKHLAPGGYLLAEIGPGQGDPLLAEARPGFKGQLVKDLAGRRRLAVLQKL